MAFIHAVRLWHDLSLERLPLNDKNIELAALGIYHLLALNAMANGEVWPENPKFICHLKNILPLPAKRDPEKSFRDYLLDAFEKETGKKWVDKNYVLIQVPLPTVGGTAFVVFER